MADPRESTKGQKTASPFVFWAIQALLPILLAVAAFLKLADLTTKPIEESGFLQHWATIGIIELEIVLAFWLFSGRSPRISRFTAVLVFVGFACINSFRLVSGRTYCDCFGFVHLPVWFSLCLDLGAIAWITLAAPAQVIQSGAVFRRSLIAIALFVLLIAPSPNDRPTIQTLEDFISTGDSKRIVLLRPGEWTGKRLPLLPLLAKRDEIQKGEWHAVMFRPDCSACQRTIDSLLHDKSGNRKLLLIEMPDSAKGQKYQFLSKKGVCWERLPCPPMWFAAVPSEFSLMDGVVNAPWNLPAK